MNSTRLRGVIAAVPTPVDRDGEPDTARFLRHAAWALGNGCDALNVLGTTGEANSLSAAQRKAVMAAAASELDRSRLMVGTGTPDLATTIELTRHAHELGFAAALVLPPFYYKGVSEDGLFAWFAKIVTGTADAAIPVYLYNFPQMTGIGLSPELAKRLAESFPGRIAGAKDSSGDLDYAAELATIANFDVFPSNEAAIASADRDGYRGCISATVNIAPRLSAGLWANQTDADLLEKVTAMRVAVSAQPLIPAVKYLIGEIHGDPDFGLILPPLLELTSGQKSQLKQLQPAA
jgi:4-hydroxy-tetrahydrodipicolinate synthase